MSAALAGLLQTLAHRERPEITDEELALLCTEVQLQRLERLSPAAGWALLASLLLAPHPSHALRALRVAGGLVRWLPEVARLHGVPQLSDGPFSIDVGAHLAGALDLAAARDAPLAVRFALLAQPLGKGGTPREIWPHHVRHERRGQAALDALAARLALPPDALALARLAVDELEHVHRVADVRAGAIAELLARADAAAQPQRFEGLLQACALDFAAYPGHERTPYPKAARLRLALAACLRADAQAPTADPGARLQRHAEAVARALRSMDAITR